MIEPEGWAAEATHCGAVCINFCFVSCVETPGADYGRCGSSRKLCGFLPILYDKRSVALGAVSVGAMRVNTR